MKQHVAVLQVGSTTLNVMIGSRGVNGTFIVAGEGACVYGGYKNGRLIEAEKFQYNLSQAVAAAEASAGEKITKLFVGVPTDFVRCAVKDLSVNLKSVRKVSVEDINGLLESGADFSAVKDYTLINRAAVYFTTDDGRKSADVYGHKTGKLSAKVSYLLAEKYFIELLDNTLSRLGITGVEYLCTALSEFMFLFDSDMRGRPVILLDIGNMDSSIIIGQGDGLLLTNSFGCGGGYITLDLFMCLNVSLDIAELLKRRVVLSLRVTDSDKYSVSYKGKNIRFPAGDANQIVADRIEQICEIISHSLKTCGIDLPDYIPAYLTGGGLSYLRGVKDFMSRRLGRPVEIVAPKQPLMDKPELSQVLSILELALAAEKL